MRNRKFSIGLRAILAIFTVTLLVSSSWAAAHWNEKVLQSFGGQSDPLAGLIFDAAGNLYGTTYAGGGWGYGAVFELSPDGSGGWTQTVLYSFCSQANCADGAYPVGGLVMDAAGNLYGTTYGGGTGNATHCYGDPGCGTVFEVTPYGQETVLYNFCSQANCADGADPAAGLIFDTAGNLYGTTYFGGGVFELSPNQYGGWTLTVLHSFGYGDGYYPQAGVIFDAAGNLYGTTSYGGDYGYGTAYELTPARGGGWTEQIIHSFNLYGTDGAYPEAGLILDAAGNLYGTNLGVAFELSPTRGGWTLTVLHYFGSGNDGADPYAGLVFDAHGNLYGTTYYGGTSGQLCNGLSEKCGTAFELSPNASGGWTETILHDFNNGNDGADPSAGLILDAAGNLYGTTQHGGPYGGGTVFELTPVYPCALCSHAVGK